MRCSLVLHHKDSFSSFLNTTRTNDSCSTLRSVVNRIAVCHKKMTHLKLLTENTQKTEIPPPQKLPLPSSSAPALSRRVWVEEKGNLKSPLYSPIIQAWVSNLKHKFFLLKPRTSFLLITVLLISLWLNGFIAHPAAEACWSLTWDLMLEWTPFTSHSTKGAVPYRAVPSFFALFTFRGK